MTNFIGRETELTRLQGLLDKQIASLVVVYGRRRIGKSRLIAHFGRDIKTYSFSGLPPRIHQTQQDQLDEFSRQMSREFDQKKKEYIDWGDAFGDLAAQTASGRILILLDEITWMGSEDPDFLGKLKNAWDLCFKNNNKLILVLCGSVSAWITKNILSSTGFHGRVSLKLHLKELPIYDCDAFWGNYSSKIASFEKLKILAVMGGIPKYLEEINPKESAEENIRRLCFTESGLLYNDFDQIFSDMLQKKSDLYGRIINILSRSSLENSELANKLNVKSGGTLTQYLTELVDAGFISRHHTWQLKTGLRSKQSMYRLCDNYLRFYLNYIYPNMEKIREGRFEQRSLSSLPAWASIMSLQVENLVLKNRASIIKSLSIPEEDIIYDNPYFQKPTARKKGCQIDYLIQTKFNNLYVCEIKFTRNMIFKDIIQEVQAKIAAIATPLNYSVRPVLIYAGAIHDDVIDQDYFAKIIDITNFFSQ